MPSNRKQKAKARKSRELDMLSDYGNMDVKLGDGNSNSIRRELDSLIIVSERQQDVQSFETEKIRLKRMMSETLASGMSPLGKRD